MNDKKKSNLVALTTLLVLSGCRYAGEHESFAALHHHLHACTFRSSNSPSPSVCQHINSRRYVQPWLRNRSLFRLLPPVGHLKTRSRLSFFLLPAGAYLPALGAFIIAPFSALENLVAEISLPIEPVRAGVAIKLLRVGKQ